MSTDTTPDLKSAKEIIVIDYAHDEASPALPWAANRVLSELGRVCGELTEYGEKYVTAQRELERLRTRLSELEAAGETRTEWGVRADADDEVIEHDTESGARFTVRHVPGTQLRRRERREYVGPWVPVEDEAVE